MTYVAILRARRIFIRFVVVFVVLAIFDVFATLGTIHHGVITVDGRMQQVRVPAGALVAAVGFVAIVCATFLASGLDADYRRAAIAWTRPFPRLMHALTAYAVDAVAVVALWVFLLALMAVCVGVEGLGGTIVPVAAGFDSVLPVAAAAAMFYGLIVAAGAAWPGHGDRVTGLAWAATLIVPVLASIHELGVFHPVFVALNYLDPLSYAGNVHIGQQVAMVGTNGAQASAWSAPLRAAVAAGWAILFLSVGTRLWTTREVAA